MPYFAFLFTKAVIVKKINNLTTLITTRQYISKV